MKRSLLGLAAAVALASACPATVVSAGQCQDSSQCNGARCVQVGGVGHCEGGTVPSGEGEKTPPSGEGEGAAPSGEGEGGAPAGEGEGAAGEGEGEGAPVDLTPHFFAGAFVGGSQSSSSAHFSLVGTVGSSFRR